MWLLYNTALALLAPVWVPWMLYRTWKRKEKPNWRERQGDFELDTSIAGKNIVWVHTVSVGEFVAAKPILRELRKSLPKHKILLSVTTSSGHQTAREAESGLFDQLVYFPIDMARFQLAAMQRVQPDVVAIMETELWLNFLWAAKIFDAQTALINGRISDRSYPRAKSIRFFYRALLQDVDQCLMQSQADAERIQSLGAREASVLGNCKFDQAAESIEVDADEWRTKLGLAGKQVVMIGSTRNDFEEDLVIEAVKQLENVAVIHAPRHLERVPALAAKVPGAALRSRAETGQYLILDTYGELAQIYAVADVVVIGGGFSNLGGQNIIQPLALGKPVIHGPHMQNFRDVAELAVRSGASIVATSAQELADRLKEILDNADKRTSMGTAARNLVDQNLGASRRYALAIGDLAEKAQKVKKTRKEKRMQSS
jgi:3-deoxy-D-manno-octulosonic-acid transferase